MMYYVPPKALVCPGEAAPNGELPNGDAGCAVEVGDPNELKPVGFEASAGWPPKPPNLKLDVVVDAAGCVPKPEKVPPNTGPLPNAGDAEDGAADVAPNPPPPNTLVVGADDVAPKLLPNGLGVDDVAGAPPKILVVGAVDVAGALPNTLVVGAVDAGAPPKILVVVAGAPPKILVVGAVDVAGAAPKILVVGAVDAGVLPKILVVEAVDVAGALPKILVVGAVDVAGAAPKILVVGAVDAGVLPNGLDAEMVGALPKILVVGAVDVADVLPNGLDAEMVGALPKMLLVGAVEVAVVIVKLPNGLDAEVDGVPNIPVVGVAVVVVVLPNVLEPVVEAVGATVVAESAAPNPLPNRPPEGAAAVDVVGAVVAVPNPILVVGVGVKLNGEVANVGLLPNEVELVDIIGLVAGVVN